MGAATLKPLWEAGVGVGHTTFHAWPGAGSTRSLTVAWPYLIYRGEHLRASGRDLRLVFFETERSWLDLSAGGWLGVDGGDDRARTGMPALDYTVQAGPRWNQRLYKSPRNELLARLALRRIWSVAGVTSFRPRGMWLEPSIKLIHRPPRWGRHGSVTFSAGAVFASRGHNGYFYDVDPAFATADRPAHRAGQGYNWSFAHVSVHRGLGRQFRIGAFLSGKFLNGSAVADSPLVRRNTWVGGGIALTWLFMRSQKMVPERRVNGE